MTLDDFKNYLKQAAEEGTLITPKHNPSSLGTIFKSYRSVLSYELAANLLEFINSKCYIVNQYENLSYPRSRLYFEIVPLPNSEFDVPASGVTAYSPNASAVLDRLVAVSGETQGLHLFGENNQTIQIKIKNQELIFNKQLK